MRSSWGAARGWDSVRVSPVPVCARQWRALTRVCSVAGAAQVFLSRGGSVLLCSRSEDKLAAAKARLETEGGTGRVSTRTLDNTNEEQVQAFFGSLQSDTFDAIIVTALGRAPHGPFLELDVKRAREAVEGKVCDRPD